MMGVGKHYCEETSVECAEKVIASSLSLNNRNSFFLCAGAGAGKTRALKFSLDIIAENFGDQLSNFGKKAAVITYTNAAKEEIISRIDKHCIFHVATLHGFAWSLIEGRNNDIRKWLEEFLAKELKSIKQKQDNGRRGKAACKRVRKIKSIEERLKNLPNIKKFIYDPSGDMYSENVLSHSDVIKIASHLIKTKKTFQTIVAGQYPFIFIDEVQDTMSDLIDAFLFLESKTDRRIVFGLFGDMMQRIYGHGKIDLLASIPRRWERPRKLTNHRSCERIVTLANRIRADADGMRQRARCDRKGGYSLAYVFPSSVDNKPEIEARVQADMARRTGDSLWTKGSEIKSLVLEIHMAAYRLGFDGMFTALHRVPDYRTGLKDGTLAPLRLFTEKVLALIDAKRAGDSYAIMDILRQHSPLASKLVLGKCGAGSLSLQRLRDATNALFQQFADDANPTCADVLGTVANTELFEIPRPLRLFKDYELLDARDGELNFDDVSMAWKDFLKTRFDEVIKYKRYIDGKSGFGTYQSIKGKQFPRVFVIIDDSSIRFRSHAKFEKMFLAGGGKNIGSQTSDRADDLSIEQLRRLIYVACTRAEKSLALVVYAQDPNAMAEAFLRKQWFSPDEVVVEGGLFASS